MVDLINSPKKVVRALCHRIGGIDGTITHALQVSALRKLCDSKFGGDPGWVENVLRAVRALAYRINDEEMMAIAVLLSRRMAFQGEKNPMPDSKRARTADAIMALADSNNAYMPDIVVLIHSIARRSRVHMDGTGAYAYFQVQFADGSQLEYTFGSASASNFTTEPKEPFTDEIKLADGTPGT